jgi:hypothetical protein
LGATVHCKGWISPTALDTETTTAYILIGFKIKFKIQNTSDFENINAIKTLPSHSMIMLHSQTYENYRTSNKLDRSSAVYYYVEGITIGS